MLVTSLQSDKLLNLQADIMSGILPWSSVTKHHFKGKVSQYNCSRDSFPFALVFCARVLNIMCYDILFAGCPNIGNID